MPNVINGVEVLYGQRTKDNSIAVVLPSDQTPIGVSDTLTTGGVEGELTLTLANTPYELKVGASPIANRKLVTAVPIDGQIYWGYTNTLTSSTGTPLERSQFAAWKMDSVGKVWLLTAVAGRKVRITESP